jgi:hypothetical protein
VDFAGSQTINEVDLFSLQDNYQAPAAPALGQTFTLYGLRDFQVEAWNGSAWVAVPNGVISGNDQVWRQVTFPSITTTKIRIWVPFVPGTTDSWSRIAEVEAWTPAAGQVNAAAAAQGATTVASSVYDAGYPSSGAINGDRTGANWGAGGVWNDGTAGNWPDWLEVDFAGSQTINEVDLFSLQDNYQAPVEPTLAQTFFFYGLRNFQVEMWDGSKWVVVPGGVISANNQVWRQITFPAVTTTKIRIWIPFVAGTTDSWSRIAEVEAWTAP